jgi:putative FmdB family regulatory protein
MPTYDYECEACSHRFERFQGITEPAVRKCPKCGKRRARRLIGPGAGLIFKGSGFYITDYRSDDYKRRAKADSESPVPKAAPSSESSASGPSSEGKAGGRASEKPSKPSPTKKKK